MALPSYSDIYGWVHEQGLEPLPAPRKRPTRKGLGRYLRDCIEANIDPWKYSGRWERRWIACSKAYAVMLSEFDLRLPSTTFAMDRLYVRAWLDDVAKEAYSDEDLPPQRRAYKWATSS